MARVPCLVRCAALALGVFTAARGSASVPRPEASANSAIPAEQMVALARIDSLWEANAGLAVRVEIERHIARARADADSLFLLNLLCREGRLLAAVNLTLEAESILREGLLLAPPLRELLLYRSCLHWLGVTLIGQGRLDDVSTCFSRLLELSRASGDRYHEGYAWMGLAYRDWQSGKAGKAREKYTRSARIFRELGQVRGELWALVGLNNVLTALGEYDEAIEGHKRIVVLGRDGGMREIEAHGHNNLGVLLFSLGDMGEALEHFQRAAALQEQTGNARESIVAGHNVCICEVMLGRTREASRRLRGLLETSRANGYADVEAQVLNALAYAHFQQGDCRLAATLFREALAMPTRPTPKIECELLTGLSQSLAAMDSTRSALRLLRSRSAEMLQLEDPRIQLAFRNEIAERLLEEGLPGEALETATVVERRGAELGLTGHRLEALPIAAQAFAQLGRQDSALALLHRGMRLWEEHRGLPLDPEWREQRGAAARRLFTQLARLNLRYPADRTENERTRAAFDALQTYKARTLLERMMGPGGREVPVQRVRSVTLGELQTRVLRRGELLLDFAIGSDSSLLFACSSAGSRALVLPGEKELKRKVLLFRELLAARPSGGSSPAQISLIDSTAANLADVLFSGCADLVGAARHLVIVPDGILNLLPMAFVLSSCRSIPAATEVEGAASIPPAVQRTVSQIPAATILAWLRRQAPDAERTDDSARHILALSSRYTDEREPLPGTAKEIGNLARRYRGVARRLSAGQLPSQIALAGFDILHFASHSTIDDQSPWRSAIHLAGGADGREQISLKASEIAGWRLSARLAVLSSCESAGGRILSGEGVQGLSSALLSAQVPSVLATRWPVDDRVTVDIMNAFYEALGDGESVAASLQRAQETVRRHPRTAHPFYWAGFVLIGEGEMCVRPLPHSGGTLAMWTTALGTAIIIAWLALRSIRRKGRTSP